MQKSYFEGYEGGYTNQSGSANDVGGKRRMMDVEMDDTKRTKTSGMDISTLSEMVKFNQQSFATLNKSDLPEAEKQEKLKKVIERQSILLEMQAEMIKTQIESPEDDPMEGISSKRGINREGHVGGMDRGCMDRGGRMGGMDRGGRMGGMDRGGRMGGMDRGGRMGGMDRGGPMGDMDRGGPMGCMDRGGPMGGMDRFGPMGGMDRFGPMGGMNRGGFNPMGPGGAMGRGFKQMGMNPRMEMGFPFGGMRGGPRGGMGPRGFPGRNVHGYLNYDDAPPPPSVSIEEKLVVFKDSLLDQFDPAMSCFQMIESCRKNIDDGMMKIRTDYRFEKDFDKNPVEITGRLKIMGIFIAKAYGTNEKMVKEEVFRKGLYILHTKSVSEILQRGTEENVLVAAETNAKAQKHHFFNNYSKTKLTLLNKKLPKTDNKKDIVRDLDFICSMNGMFVTCVLYRGVGEDGKINENVVCDVYVDDCFLGTGEGSERKDAIKLAYIDCKRTLQINLIEDIVAETKKLTKLDRNDLRILDILNKGRFYEIGSNIGSLMINKASRRYEIEPQREVVVMIQSGEQEPVPFKVLDSTATANGLLLEYVLHCSEKSKDCKDFRCFMYINGKLISCSIGQNKPQAKFSAAECAVQELTCRYSLIEYSTRKYIATTTNEDLVELAMTLKRSGRDISQEVPQEFITNEDSIDELDPYLYRVLENMVLEYSSLETLDELIFGPDLPELVVEQIVKKCKEWQVDGNKRVTGGRTFVVVHKIRQFTATQMSDFLLSQPNFNNGRYTLIHLRQPKGKLQFLNNCSSDIRRYLKKADEDENDDEEDRIPEDLGLFE